MKKMVLIPLVMGCLLGFTPLKGVVSEMGVGSDKVATDKMVVVEQKVITEQDILNKLDLKDRPIFQALTPEQKLIVIKAINNFVNRVEVLKSSGDLMNKDMMKGDVKIDSSKTIDRTIDINR